MEDSGQHSMRFAPLAQLVEQRLYTAEATGSSPVGGTVCEAKRLGVSLWRSY